MWCDDKLLVFKGSYLLTYAKCQGTDNDELNVLVSLVCQYYIIFTFVSIKYKIVFLWSFQKVSSLT